MKAEDFKPRDIVTVNTGGPRMTVASIEMGKVFCEWYDKKTGKQQAAIWSPAVLVKNEPPEDLTRN
jgi:uncharacterized protein YodC (DUF2158 family)